MYFDADDLPPCRTLTPSEMGEAVEAVLRGAARFRAERQAKEEAAKRRAEEYRRWWALMEADNAALAEQV